MRGVTTPPPPPAVSTSPPILPPLEAPSQQFYTEPTRRGSSPSKASQLLSPIGEGSIHETSPEVIQGSRMGNILTQSGNELPPSTTPDYLGNAFPFTVPSPENPPSELNTSEYYPKFMANAPPPTEAPPLIPVSNPSGSIDRSTPVSQMTMDSNQSAITHLTYAPPTNNNNNNGNNHYENVPLPPSSTIYSSPATSVASNVDQSNKFNGNNAVVGLGVGAVAGAALLANDSQQQDRQAVQSPEKLPSNDLPEETSQNTKPLFSPSMQNTRSLPSGSPNLGVTTSEVPKEQQRASFDLPEGYNIHSDVS